MSSLPSEAEASKILDDERSGQAVMEDFLEGRADALGFIDPESDDDAPDASLQNDAAALMAAPTREGIDGPAAAPTAAEAEDVVDHEARAALLERLLEASQKDLRAAEAKVDSANRRAQGFRALLADAKSRHSRQEQELAELRASKNLACELLAALKRQLGAEEFARITTSIPKGHPRPRARACTRSLFASHDADEADAERECGEAPGEGFACARRWPRASRVRTHRTRDDGGTPALKASTT